MCIIPACTYDLICVGLLHHYLFVTPIHGRELQRDVSLVYYKECSLIDFFKGQVHEGLCHGYGKIMLDCVGSLKSYSFLQ